MQFRLVTFTLKFTDNGKYDFTAVIHWAYAGMRGNISKRMKTFVCFLHRNELNEKTSVLSPSSWLVHSFYLEHCFMIFSSSIYFVVPNSLC